MIWENIFLLFVAVLPFVTWQGMFEGPKVFYLYVGIIFLCIFYIVTLGKKLILGLKKYDIYFGLFLVTLTVSSVLGIHPMESIVGGSYRHQGVIFFFAIWLIGKTIYVLGPKAKNRLTKILPLIIIAECVIVFAQKLFNFSTLLGRPLGTLGEPNAVAGLLAMGASFVGVHLWVLVVLAIIFLNSRTGFISFLPVVLTKIKKIPRKILLVAIPIGLLIFISASYFRPESRVEDRKLFAKIAVSAIAKKPILGYGAETGEVIYDNYFKSIREPLVGIIVDRSHNLVLDLLLWSGVVGTTFFVIWFYQRTKVYFLAKKWDKIASLASFLLYSFLQPLSVVHWLFLVIIFDL